MSCSVGCRCSLDPMLLWLWYRPVARAPVRPLAWEKDKRQKTKQNPSEMIGCFRLLDDSVSTLLSRGMFGFIGPESGDMAHSVGSPGGREGMGAGGGVGEARCAGSGWLN